MFVDLYVDGFHISSWDSAYVTMSRASSQGEFDLQSVSIVERADLEPETAMGGDDTSSVSIEAGTIEYRFDSDDLILIQDGQEIRLSR